MTPSSPDSGSPASVPSARLAELRRLFAYEAWAGRETLAALRAAAAARALPAPALARMGHLVGAGRLWLGRLCLDRLRGEPPAVVWPALDLAACAAGWEELEGGWERYLGGLTEPALGASVAYVNSRGESWSSRVADVLTHVILHGAHHRGQIAADLRAAGAEPPYVDFIEAVRRGKLPGPSDPEPA